jgi:hypothetical protein
LAGNVESPPFKIYKPLSVKEKIEAELPLLAVDKKEEAKSEHNYNETDNNNNNTNNNTNNNNTSDNEAISGGSGNITVKKISF